MSLSKYLIYFTYLMVLLGCAKPSQQDSDRRYEPLSLDEPLRIAVTSCTHIGFLSALNQLDKVVAVCNRDLVYTDLQDSVVDLGDAMSPSLERLLDANVNLVFVSSFSQNEFAHKVQQLGIKVVYIDEWREQTPLKRAAWIKDFGQVLGCQERADSVYTIVETRYKEIADAHKSITIHPIMMTGNNFRGTWYVPAGNTYMGKLFYDCGANYLYQQDERGESIPLTIEEIVASFTEADVWVGSSAYSLQELALQDEKHTWLKPYKKGNVYNWLKQSSKTGANNFWERGVVHPEEILEDLSRIVDATMMGQFCDSDSLHYALRLD